MNQAHLVCPSFSLRGALLILCSPCVYLLHRLLWSSPYESSWNTSVFHCQYRTSGVSLSTDPSSYPAEQLVCRSLRWCRAGGDSCGCDVLLSWQDEQSAVSMLKKHQILEQAVEDYAETVHQLSKTSRALVADSHPER